MIDLRPVGYVIGLLISALGASMAIPMAVDFFADNGHAWTFLQSAVLTCLTGGMMALACANSAGSGLTLRQTFLLTTGTWTALPMFGALPFALGVTGSEVVDAYFEAVSGMTTTGSTVLSGLDDLPPGLLLWRSMLQWFGGIGVVVVAMVFLPELRIGGMQMFRSEAFDTMGKILPRATAIAGQISGIYAALTVVCVLAYLAAGQSLFDAVNHALTTLSTGGFSPSDDSMGKYSGASEYVATLFMLLGSLPFVRYIQILNGGRFGLFDDTQVRAMLAVLLTSICVVTAWLIIVDGYEPLGSFREVVFNMTSIMTGTGYASVDYQFWGPMPVTVIFFLGLIGGCAGSTCCSVKIFRYQILMSSIKAQIRRIHSPHGVFTPRFDGRPVPTDVLSSVMAFFVLFTVTLGVFAVALGATGLDLVTSVSGAATAIGNIGPGLGDTIGPAGNFGSLSDTAKWLLIAAMLIGRLELMAVFVLFTTTFWRTA